MQMPLLWIAPTFYKRKAILLLKKKLQSSKMKGSVVMEREYLKQQIISRTRTSQMYLSISREIHLL